MLRSDIACHRLLAQRIANPESSTPEAIVTHLGAMQAQDYPGALWSIGLRLTDATRVDVERAITDRTIVRTWPMRGTLHFIPAADARWMLELMTPRIVKGAAGRHRQLELDDAAFRKSRSLISKALEQNPILTRAALFAALDKGGVSTEGQRGIHILQRLSMECMLCYGPHSDKQPTFTLFDEWIASSLKPDRDDALRILAERFFVSHGPASMRDFVGWTGLTVADAKTAVHLALPVLEKISTDDGDFWMAADRITPTGAEPRAHLLPGFDEFMLGYKDRSAALAARYSDRIVPGGNGMFLSTLVVDGQVSGTWRRAARAKTIKTTAIEASPFGRLDASAKKAFSIPRERYARFLGAPVTLAWERR
ncbi:MAG: winged helix DNA-binding domain-containing protein [bacterium]